MLEAPDLSSGHPSEVYANLLPDLEKYLNKASQTLYATKRPLIVVIQGWSTAGVLGIGRSVYAGLDPRGCRVFPPDEGLGKAERQHYLRFYWKRLPAAGQSALFYHSWYQRVLADRVLERLPAPAWRRAYREIKQFERQLTDFGAIIAKFWLHLSPAEHIRRFDIQSPGDCWDHPDRWEAACSAVEEALLKTNQRRMPWVVIPAEDPTYASTYLLYNLLKQLISVLNLRGKSWRKIPGEGFFQPIESPPEE